MARKADSVLFDTCELLAQMFLERKNLADSFTLFDKKEKMSNIRPFPFQKWKFCPGAVMALCMTTKDHIEELERYDNMFMSKLKKKYWKTHEGRRDWYWWRCGKDDYEDLDDFVLNAQTASAYRKYKFSRMIWYEKINEILTTLCGWGNKLIAPDQLITILRQLNGIMNTARTDFREFNKALQTRLDTIDWSPPRHPYNTGDIENKMSEFEHSFMIPATLWTGQAFSSSSSEVSTDKASSPESFGEPYYWTSSESETCSRTSESETCSRTSESETCSRTSSSSGYSLHPAFTICPDDNYY